MTKTHESDFVRALKARPRRDRDLDVSELLGFPPDSLPRVRLRVLSGLEANQAIAAAHKELATLTQAKSPVITDEGFFDDLKNVQALWRAFCDPDDPAQPVFASPDAMRAELDTDQLSALLAAYHEHRRETRKEPRDLDAERVDAYRAGLAMRDSELPELALAPFTREFVTRLAVELARRWTDERTALLARIDQLETPAAPATEATQ